MAAGCEKRTPWWNQDFKTAIQAKKDAFKALLQNRSSSDLQCQYSEARNAAAQAVKMSKTRSWEKFGRRLDSNYSSANKVFWLTIRQLRGKSLSITTSMKNSAGNILRDEKKILSHWREYFEDLLNPVRTTLTGTCDTINFGKQEVFTLTVVVAAIRELRSGKAAGEDEIRPEMLKALNREGVRYLTRVCQVAWKLGKHQKIGKQVWSFLNTRLAIVKNVQIIKEYHFLALQERYMPCALKGNAEK